MAKSNKTKSDNVNMSNIPSCPVCLEAMTIPIFQCKSGHSLCNNCTKKLYPPFCPMCRQDMTQVRNWQLEDVISKVKKPCPNKKLGCIYLLQSAELDNHLKECTFRLMDCPLGAVFGKCSWNGQVKDISNHFKDRHIQQFNPNPDDDLEIKVNLNEDERYMFLLKQNQKLFILTVKIDVLKKAAFWTIQHIGSKFAAQHYVYEIHVTSKKNDKRRFVYTENCFNELLKSDEIFSLGKCPIIPLNVLKHFVKDGKLVFRYLIKNVGPPQPKPTGANVNKKNTSGNTQKN